MKKYTIAQYLMAGGMVGGVLFADTASAIDWNITGFVRQEIAYSLNWGCPEFCVRGVT